MNDQSKAIAIVGVGAILPDASNAVEFWNNLLQGRYSISETPADRWSIADYYDSDPTVPDKTYTKIGGWVKGFEFDWKKFKIPPRVAGAMDMGQQWAVTIAAQALEDYGYPARPLDIERTGVVLGTAMGGELHYLTTQRIVFPEYAHALQAAPAYDALPRAVRDQILGEFHAVIDSRVPQITEDSMPGELPNIVAGRVANVLNLRGPNFITDAACASSLAALDAAWELLSEHEADAVITGGVDRNMGVGPFVKFCKIGALSATGTRPFGKGADGFVMGEGSASFLVKRLQDAERDDDKIYAVVRGVGAASDGKGKGITAPNPIGQQLATRRAWEYAGLDPATAVMIEAHGTSTRVGDVVEVDSLSQIFGGAPRNSIALGSVKSNIGHLKAGAGAAGLLKAVLAIHHSVIPPTLNARVPNPDIAFEQTPFSLVQEPRALERRNGVPRRVGVSAYGFGGTNFHVVLEEHVPGMLSETKRYASVDIRKQEEHYPPQASPAPLPPRGILALGGANTPDLKNKLEAVFEQARNGYTPEMQLPDPRELDQPERIVLDFGTHDELVDRLDKALKAMGLENPAAWKALQAQGVFRGSGAAPGRIAFLFPGQGSQYLNMGRALAKYSPTVRAVFDRADAVMLPILGKPLTSYIYADGDREASSRAEQELQQTAITQPAMLTLDTAIAELLGDFGFHPDMVMGHSLGEYAALIAAGAMPFADALEASAARGAEMTKVSMADNGWMAAVMAPLAVVDQTLEEIDGYVVAANINGPNQCVIGGESKAVEKAIELFTRRGYQAQRLPVSHAFHTRIVAPASDPLRRVLDRLHISSPTLPLVANVTGEFYPTSPDEIKDTLQLQVASTVQWVKGIQTLYAAGVRTFVEVGPKKALKGLVDEILADKSDVVSLFTNHPKVGELPTFNQALCGLYAAGYGVKRDSRLETNDERQMAAENPTLLSQPVAEAGHMRNEANSMGTSNGSNGSNGQDLAALLTKALSQMNRHQPSAVVTPYDRNETPPGSIVFSGTGLGLPGAEKPVMDPDNALRILRGEQFVDLIPERFRKGMLAKRVTRLVKDEDGSGHFETITNPDEVIKLAGRPGPFNLSEEYGVPAKLVEALDITTQLAMAAGLDALREAGIPLVQTYKKTSKGTFLPDRWLLPEALRDETGIIFASAFPGGDRFADEFQRYYTWENRQSQLKMLLDLQNYTTDPATASEFHRRIGELRETIEREPYEFDRRFLFRVLAMGHSQFAEYIGARGPNTHVNAACASTTQAIGLAEDWIRDGRARHVIVVAADAPSGDHLMEWLGAGFLATGAVATDDRVDEAALPFDRRRHGTLLGMGACALVIESQDAVQERGMRGIVELLASEINNSAFHGTRLDVNHISQVMNNLVSSAERRFGVNRSAIASTMVFMSHETFTPARGGSASAEVYALRQVFGEMANNIIVANTKGFTGHPFGVGIEDVIATKILEYGIVPPVPNFKEVDPDLGVLNLSRGGRYPVQYALHLGAGFGSQIAMTLTRRIPGTLDRIENKAHYNKWLADVSGYDTAETEVVKRVLRVQSAGAPKRIPAPSIWQQGTGPTVRVQTSDGAAFAPPPARMVIAPRETDAPRAKPIARQQVESIIPRTEPVIPKLDPTVEPVTPRPAATPVPQPAAPGPVASGNGKSVDFTPPAVTTSPIAPVLPSTTDTITEQVLGIVAIKTGYPREMLDLDLDMEADLGIDTVKQAETFAAIRETFNIPRRDNLKLRDYPTLQHVVEFVRQSRPNPEPASVPTPAAQLAAPAEGSLPTSAAPDTPRGVDEITGRVLDIIAAKTGYPREMLDLDLDMEADLGIDTVKQAETFAAIRQAFDIPRRDNLKLRDYPTLKHVVEYVRKFKPNQEPERVARTSEQLAAPAQKALPTSAPPDAPVRNDEITERVLEIVAAKTGYPREMLDLELDLEADLGIDTVKQAETFAAIREAFGIARIENLKLRDYPTLGSVIAFVEKSRPDLKATNTVTPAPGALTASMVQTLSSTPADNPETDSDQVTETVLAIVAAKTGYPVEMLDLDLDLEADLGVDTVKQAETFAAVREAFGIARIENLKLRDYPTLGHVVEFVRSAQSSSSGAAPEHSAVQTESPESPPQKEDETIALQVVGTLDDADRIPRRVPTPSLRPPLDWCTGTGVSLDQHSRVIVMMDQSGVGEALVSQLRERQVTPLGINESLSRDGLETRVKAWLSEGAIQGVYWLPALDIEPNLQDMDLEQWREANRLRVKNLYTMMRVLYESVNTQNTFLVSATRMGGLHGYGPTAEPNGASAPLGGAVTGFTKAYKRERNAAVVKAIDFPCDLGPDDCANALLAETYFDPGVVEVGHYQGNRYGITLLESPSVMNDTGMHLDHDTVFLVTGAAGGITSAITADLAVHSGGTFYLLDLVEPPADDDENIKLFRAGKDKLKAELIEQAKRKAEKPTPASIDKTILRIERQEAALRALQTVRAAGGTAHFYAGDLRAANLAEQVMADIRKRHNKIDVLVHAAGVEISRSLADKEPEQFDLVFDVKADGFFNLLRAARDMPIGSTVVFSSVAGRFGNSGQTDYSAANDLLCKITTSLRRWRPGTRGIAIDWTAWADIGMATRGSIPKIMEMAGISMLPAVSGVPTVRRELVRNDFRGEIVVADSLGVLTQEWDETGGLDSARVNTWLREHHSQFPLIERVTAAKLYSGITAETTLDPKREPFLFDHQIEDVPLLPGVMGTEVFAELAQLVAPGVRVSRVMNESFERPFKFHRMQPQTLYLSLWAEPAKDGEIRAHAALKSVTTMMRGEMPPQEKMHFRADVVLSNKEQTTERAAPETLSVKGKGKWITADQIYNIYFHGPAYRVLERARVSGDMAIGELAVQLPPDTADKASNWLFAPRLIELCFQTAGIWQIKTKNTMALPLALESVSVYRQLPDAVDGKMYAVVRALDGASKFDATVVNETGTVFVKLSGYQTVSLPGTVTI